MMWLREVMPAEKCEIASMKRRLERPRWRSKSSMATEA
jgi:hypothetical protein